MENLTSHFTGIRFMINMQADLLLSVRKDLKWESLQRIVFMESQHFVCDD